MNGIKNYLVQHGETQLNDIIELERGKVGMIKIYSQRIHVCCGSSSREIAYDAI